jgi:hypothetical protein
VGTRVFVCVAAVGLLAGCGVQATDTPVKIAGGGLAAGVDASGDTTFTPPNPSPFNQPREVITDFLEAAVGGGDAAVKQVHEFLTTKAVETFNPAAPQPAVIRLVAAPSQVLGQETSTVTIAYQIVGGLTDQGTLEPSADIQVHHDTFTLVRRANTWTIDVLPPLMTSQLVISDDMLDSSSGGYRAKPIYFWDHNGTLLVPDLRYLPLTMDISQRPNAIVDWLIAGPSPLVASAVKRLPAGTVKIGNVTSNNGSWVVNLSARAGGANPDDLKQIAYQLRWSLLSVTHDKVELQIEGQPKNAGFAHDADALDANPPTSAGARFEIIKRKISVPAGTDIPVLKSPLNANVVAAAINVDTTRAAIVTEHNGMRSLTLLRENTDGKVFSYPATLAPTPQLGRPAFVGHTDRLLVPAHGDLYVVAPTGAATKITPGPSTVTSVAVPPDGRRIALVMGGHAYVGSLFVNGSTVGVGPLQEVAAGMLRAGGIAWQDSSHVLIVGGAIDGNAPAMVTSTVDSAAAKQTSFAANGFTLVDVVTQTDVAASDIIVQTSDQKVEQAFTSGTTLPVGGVDSVFYSAG